MNGVFLDDEDGYIGHRAPPSPEVGEGLVAGGVNHEEAGYLDVRAEVLHQPLRDGDKGFKGEIAGTYLLRQASSLPQLDSGAPDHVE